MRPTRDVWAMQIALLTAQRSTCCRRQVGCVLLNSRGHIIATGYNGVAVGLPHCNEVTPRVLESTPTKDGETYGNPEFWELPEVGILRNACAGANSPSGTNLEGCQAIHAEQNALLQCRDVYEIHTACVTTSPCVTCCKLLLNTSCERIIFANTYPHPEAKELWVRAGRHWVELNCK